MGDESGDKGGGGNKKKKVKLGEGKSFQSEKRASTDQKGGEENFLGPDE